MNPSQLYLQEYPGGKSFAVFGDTQTWKADLKNLGGKYNPSLKHGGYNNQGGPGWTFGKSKTNVAQLSNFIQQANAGMIRPTPSTEAPQLGFQPAGFQQPQVSFQPSAIPIQSTVKNGITYQLVRYELPEPFVGQKVTVNYAGQDYNYNVVDTKKSSDNSFVESFRIQSNRYEPVKVIISNGEWQMDIPNPPAHTFKFFPPEAPQIPQLNFSAAPQTQFPAFQPVNTQVPSLPALNVQPGRFEPSGRFGAPPMSTFQPEPSGRFGAPPMSTFQPAPVTNFQPEPSGRFGAPPVTNFQPAPVTNFQPEPSGRFGAPPMSTFQPAPVTNFQPEPSGRFGAPLPGRFGAPPTTTFQPPTSPSTFQPVPTTTFQPPTSPSTFQPAPVFPAQTQSLPVIPPLSPRSSGQAQVSPTFSGQTQNPETRRPGSYIEDPPVLYPVNK